MVQVKFTPIKGEERELIRYEIVDKIVVCERARCVIAGENTFVVDNLAFRRVFGDDRWDFFNAGEEVTLDVQLAQLGYDRCDKAVNLLGKPENGEVMEAERFYWRCRNGLFMDHDGFGHYMYEGEETDLEALPSVILHKNVVRGFDGIVWYNK